MVREKTFQKIFDLEQKYGSVLKAHEDNIISYSTYHYYRNIVIDNTNYWDFREKELKKLAD